MFIHQLSHVWVDFRGIRDAFMRAHDLDYFENSRRAAFVQQQYAIRNPREFEHYDEFCWGITSSDGPGPGTLLVDGIERVFYDFIARGAPYGPDDGTLAPWAVVASLPFAPEIVLPTIQNYQRMQLNEAQRYGYKATFNPTFPVQPKHEYGWVSPYHFGLNQGPIAIVIENYFSGCLWSLMRQCPYLVTACGVQDLAEGGWRDEKRASAASRPCAALCATIPTALSLAFSGGNQSTTVPGSSPMEKKSRRQAKKAPRLGSDRAAAAARDPKEGARNRPGFDLGGAVGDAKPDGKGRNKRSTVRMNVDPVSKAARVPGGTQSAVAGVRTSLGGKYQRRGIR